ncbi:peptidylprolyl isomerase [Stutzerimonas stutzeri]|uniref:peptidylprolyl isomerase n=1 Tax=Pseudomonadaceae TaxID=135621 RepID=UPI0024A4A745|nr:MULTISPECIES: peptidylprolyl isomerase [Pseudomonadaceae]GLZ23976.1 peptidylprolyl isomerase [Stutzerimonas stutzeri]
MNKRTVFIGCGASLLLAAVVSMTLEKDGGVQVALASVEQPAPLTTVARLGDQYVEASELQALLSGLPEAARQQLRDNRPALDDWLRSRLAEKRLLDQADAQGWTSRPEIQQMTRSATEQIVLRTYLESVSQVPDDYPGEDELRAVYEANKASWITPASFQVSQIFLAIDGRQSLDAVRKQAVELAKRARDGKVDFAELAAKHSQDRESAQRGGDIGKRSLEQLLPEVRPALARLEVGAVSEPVQSASGFHILKLTDLQPARVATLDEVRTQLQSRLRSVRQEQIAKAYMEGLINSAQLSIDGAVLSEVLEQGR